MKKLILVSSIITLLGTASMTSAAENNDTTTDRATGNNRSESIETDARGKPIALRDSKDSTTERATVNNRSEGMDADEIGKPTALKDSKNRMKDNEREMSMKAMDANGDGKVTKQEFMAHQEKKFDRMKKNESGSIDVKGNDRVSSNSR